MKKHYFLSAFGLLIAKSFFTISILLIVLIPLDGFGDNIKSATGEGTVAVSATAELYVDVASATVNIGTLDSDVTEVLVVATYEIESGDKNANEVRFRLLDVTNIIGFKAQLSTKKTR